MQNQTLRLTNYVKWKEESSNNGNSNVLCLPIHEARISDELYVLSRVANLRRTSTHSFVPSNTPRTSLFSRYIRRHFIKSSSIESSSSKSPDTWHAVASWYITCKVWNACKTFLILQQWILHIVIITAPNFLEIEMKFLSTTLKANKGQEKNSMISRLHCKTDDDGHFHTLADTAPTERVIYPLDRRPNGLQTWTWL